jgi:predicted O-methyltransferase YrrM
VDDALRETAPPEFQPAPDFPSLTLNRGELIQSLQDSLSKLLIHQTAKTDPTPLLEHYRGCYGTQLLVAAVAHFDLFRLLAKGPYPERELQQRLQLADRPCQVLLTALAAMRLIQRSQGSVQLTELGAGHLAGGPFDLSDYIRLLAGSPDVLALVETLRTNHPQPAANGGTAFIFRAGVPSAMDSESLARFFTEALAGRARIVAPVLARTLEIPVDRERVLLDVGGGTGLYSIALLANHPRLRAIVLDRPEVLQIAEEYARNYGVADRLTCLPGDMFSTPLPQADYLLLSNILHDWDVPDCRRLVNAGSQALAPGGQLWIHDVFLNDELDGPLPIALYSAALFSITEGRAYSGAEYRTWLNEAGLQVQSLQPTAVHCGVLIGQK